MVVGWSLYFGTRKDTSKERMNERGKERAREIKREGKAIRYKSVKEIIRKKGALGSKYVGNSGGKKEERRKGSRKHERSYNKKKCRK